MNTPLWFIPVALALAWVPSFAEKADRHKPMLIESDLLRYDDLKQINVFTGKVVMTKGSIVIRAGRIDVRQDADGYQFGVAAAEPGQRAFYRQKREGVDEYIEGEARTIEYDGKADTVKFVDQAVLRRYKGAVLNDEMSAGVILYDNTTEVFSMNGVPGAAAGRVRAMLTPKSAASAASSSELSKFPATVPVLRPSSGLSEARK